MVGEEHRDFESFWQVKRIENVHFTGSRRKASEVCVRKTAGLFGSLGDHVLESMLRD